MVRLRRGRPGGLGQYSSLRLLTRAGSASTLAAGRSVAYAPPMIGGTRAAIDHRLEGLVVARARRRMPVLRLVPAGWIRPVIKPTVVRLKVSLLLAALASAVTVGSIVTLLILVR